MESPKFTPSPELIEALKAAVRIHGRNAKAAIRRAWFNGNYPAECLGDHAYVLQDMRNSCGGWAFFKNITLKSIKEI